MGCECFDRTGSSGSDPEKKLVFVPPSSTPGESPSVGDFPSTVGDFPSTPSTSVELVWGGDLVACAGALGLVMAVGGGGGRARPGHGAF